MKNFFRQKKGVTLLETVLYVSIIAIVAALVVQTILSMFFAFSRARDIRRVSLDGSFALERMTREIRLASAVRAGESVFNVHPSVLSLDTVKSSSDAAPSVKKIYIQDDRIVLEEDGVSFYLTSPRATTTSFIFRSIETPHSNGIKIEIALETDSRKETISQSFYNSVILRESYK